MRSIAEDIQAVSRIPAVATILEVMARSTGMRFTAVARVTDSKWTACAVRDEIAFGLKPGDELTLETTICNEIRQHGHAIIFGSASAHPQFCEHPTPKMYGFESYISIPIMRADGSFFGTLCAIDPKPAKLDDPNLLRTFELFTQLIATHLDTLDQLDHRAEALTAAAAAAQRLDEENRRIAALMSEREQVEETIRRELKDTRRLRDVAARLIGSGDGSALFEEILAAAIDITQADAGTIQLLDTASQSLTFLATRGFGSEMTDHFATVEASSGSPCGTALRTGQRAFVVFDNPNAVDADGSDKLHLNAGLRGAQSTPLLSRSGQPLGMFSTHWRAHRELSERELRFLDLLGRQAADLIERTQVQEALRSSERELRDAARRKDEFLAMLAHELRNPLAPIRSGIDLLKHAQRQPAVIEQIRPMMERQVGHMVRLIDDLLDVSRITSGRVELQREIVTLESLIGSAVEAHRGAIANANLELKISLNDPTRCIEVDPTRLSQVISNILHNAIKFTPTGGRISIRAEFVAEDGGMQSELILRISDTGIGIQHELLPTIFELFTQVRHDGSQRHGGLGIGLALARSLVELHGGSLMAESAGPGHGSEFFVRIPVTAASAAGYVSRPADSVSSLDGLRVLVVDDNKDAADSIGLLVSELGADVRITYDGVRALKTLQEFHPSLVLLDIGMPEVDGYQACRQMRSEKGRKICIVAVTGWGQEEDRRRASEAGFDAHLTKPVDFAKLAEIALVARGLHPA